VLPWVDCTILVKVPILRDNAECGSSIVLIAIGSELGRIILIATGILKMCLLDANDNDFVFYRVNWSLKLDKKYVAECYRALL